MDKQPVGTLPDLTASSLDDEIMIITDSERSTLQKEKVSDFLTDITSTDENNSLIKGNDGKLFVSKSIEATDIEGVLDISNIPDIPLTKLPDTGVSAGTYQNPRNLQVNSKGLVISVDNMSQGEISDITPFITNCILANNGAEITTQSYEDAAYVNNGCSVSDADIASGFGANNFILLNKTMTDANAFVMTIPFKVNSTAGIQPLAAINNQENCIRLDGGVLSLKYNGLELKGSVVVSTATQYYAVLTRTETGYSLELKNSLEPETEALDTINLTSTAGFFGGKSIYLGVDKSGNFLNGEIDLAQLVITAGGEAYWSNASTSDFETVTLSGSLQVLMPDGRNADQTLKNVEQTITLNDVLLFNNSTGNAKTVLVKQDGEIMIRDFYAETEEQPDVPLNGVWFDIDNNVMNTQLNTYPNFINTGVTIESGVISGFSAENFLQLPEQYNLGGNWEISLALTPASTTPTEPTQPTDATDATTPTDATDATDPTEPTTATPCGLIGNIEVIEDGNYIPDGVGLVYDGTGNVTAIFRRNDVYNVRKNVVLSTAYEVQQVSDSTIGYVQTTGESGTYVAAETQVYSDPQFEIPLETAAADTWQYTGQTEQNTQILDGYSKIAGDTLVPENTVIYSDADCKNIQGTATGADYVYTGYTSTSIIGTLTDTITAGQENTVILSYDGANYKLNTKTLASTDTIRNNIVVPLGKALSTGGYFTGTINLTASAFSFWTWNGLSETVADLVRFVGVKIGKITVSGGSIASADIDKPLNLTFKQMVLDAIQNANPIGRPIFCLNGETLNSNEIWLEGAEVSKAAYSQLYAVYGDTYGEASSPDNFVLPDFRNRSIWGSSDAAFGYQSAALPNIKNTADIVQILGGNNNTRNQPLNATVTTLANVQSGNTYHYRRLSFDASIASPIYQDGATVIPQSLKVRVKTRYK